VFQDSRVRPATRVRLVELEPLEHRPTSVVNARPDAQVSQHGTIPPGVSRWIGISVAVGVRDIRTDRRLYQSMSFVAFISGCESRIVCAKAVKKLDLG